MWYPQTKGDITSHDVITDERMQEMLKGDIGNGWTVELEENGIVSAWKNGRFIRHYAHED